MTTVLPLAIRDILITATAIAALSATDCSVDQPEAWYDVGSSHHLKHGEGGAILGVAVYSLAATFTDSRPRRYALALGTAGIIGFGYEILHAKGACYMDPVDAGWVVVGAAIGAIAADLTGEALGFAVKPEAGGTTVAASLAWRF